MTTATFDPPIRRLSAAERIGLAPRQADAWRGTLTVEQFVNRNRRLERHPFGARRCHAWALEKEGQIVSSLDALDITLGALDHRGDWREVPGVLIASVITPPEHRGHGYASSLLHQFFQRPETANAVLYSDIAPAFYERFGFHAFPRYVATGDPRGGSDLPASSELELAEFAARLGAHRQQLVRGSAKPGGSLIPDAELLDWKVERFRYIADLAGTVFPQAICWSLPHDSGHLLAAVPHFLQAKLDVFWMEIGCAECHAACAQLTARHRLSGYRYWVPHRQHAAMKEELPMIRLAGVGPAAVFHDSQFLDWW
jgi:GNAT superfamily N-acetyltransferase